MRIPALTSSGRNPEIKVKVEFQMLGNKQQVVWALFKMWVTLKTSVGFFKSHFHSRFQCMLLTIEWVFNKPITIAVYQGKALLKWYFYECKQHLQSWAEVAGEDTSLKALYPKHTAVHQTRNLETSGLY